ncbi:MAG: DNA polymerase IV [Deltaproteobacteria bacterium]|nr:DNA polymerase IV [Deltaproteobacteria bacterium]
MTDRAILHVDMDAFYASVEQRDDPSLRGRPVIVGGRHRGVVLAASYEVRPFGVRSAMPMAHALRLAPRDVVVVRPRFDAYVAASERLHEIFSSVTDLIEPLSLDEAFLDVTGSRALFGEPEAIARTLRQRIRDELHLPASAGVAPVKFVAKIGSDLAKPDGLRVVRPGEARRFLAPLSVARLWGVGPATHQRLAALGLATIDDIARRDRDELVRSLGPLGAHLHDLSHGIDPRPVTPDRDAKSIGAEDTFGEDLSTRDELLPHLHAQALRVARRLRRSGRVARGVVLKLKTHDFELRTRRTTLRAATDDGQVLYEAVAALLSREDELGALVPMRLAGVSAVLLEAPTVQPGLFDAGARRATKLNGALDAIANRFGVGAVRPADVLDTDRGTLRDEVLRRDR